jgi:hypothetical protein
MSEDLITKIYNSFNPFEPLKPDDPAYVNCSAVRGNEDIFREVGKKIIRADRKTCQLYTGHRGVGKSTELLRLKKYLEKNGCFVVYFGATEGDIDEQDAHYTDIILACTRHILEELKDCASPKPLLNWLQSRWTALKDLALSEVDFEQLQVEQQIGLFTKLTASVRRIPSKREEIRKQVDLYSVPLIDALNDFIAEAKQKLPNNKSKIVVIADNLDRIVPVERGGGKTNHDEIFLDYSNQLTALDCHIIYTVPISLVYSNRAPDLRNIYDTPQVLPMIAIETRDDKIFEPGIEALKAIIEKRLEPYVKELFDLQNKRLENLYDLGVFDTEATRLKLFKMTGGHVRELMLFMQSSMDWIDNLPITDAAVKRAINEARESTYRVAIDEHEWDKLAVVNQQKKIPNEEGYRSLLFRRCVLEYQDINEQGDMVRWHDIHPLIEDLEEFKTALNKLNLP